jgi:hypothetical protein
MSSFFSKLKAKASGKRKSSSGPPAEAKDKPATGSSEQTFSTQPHPAVSLVLI